MDNLNEVIDRLMDCGLRGSVLTIHIDTDHPPTWGMHIRTDGSNEYYLAALDNGVYSLQGAIALPQALISSGPEGELIGFTMDPEKGVCQTFIKDISRDTLMLSFRSMRLSLRKLRHPPQVNHNNN